MVCFQDEFSNTAVSSFVHLKSFLVFFAVMLSFHRMIKNLCLGDFGTICNKSKVLYIFLLHCNNTWIRLEPSVNPRVNASALEPLGTVPNGTVPFSLVYKGSKTVLARHSLIACIIVAF